jgi:tRNA pseudouridine38-40 synthase
MPTYRLDLSYDGTGFRGWARNAGVRTVQEEIEDALTTFLGAAVQLTVAGRTDAGVHARHQVASFESDAVDVDAAVRSLRTMLAPEISIKSLEVSEPGFSARFSATYRRYRFFVSEAPDHDPLEAHRVWHVGDSLDLSAMNRAAQAFVGEHDFASLCRASPGRTTERTVVYARWGREGSLLAYDVKARAFCHQMVRSMVALCVDIGRGRVDAADVPDILDARDRSAARGVAPPHGLVLWEVEY